MQIKQKNETLKANTYAQFWKQTSTSHRRLLTTFESKRGRMKMTFLEAQVPSPKTSVDYKKTILSFDTKLIHPIDQMDMHRKYG